MIKRYIIAVDSKIPSLVSDDIRMLVFKKDTYYDTIEDAEKAIALTLDKINEPLYVIPVYTKK